MLETENNRRSLLGLSLFSDYEEYEASNKSNGQDRINLKKDFMLQETVNIAKDYINLVAVK